MGGRHNGGGFEHEPVMITEIVDVFASVPSGVVVDATLGGGGHADAILRSRDDLSLVGLDQDPMALAAAADRLASHGERVRLVRCRFDRLAASLDELSVASAVGVLFDLGVSSPQVDLPERGFSYRTDGPLDMRMDTDQELTAEVLVNQADGKELAAMIRRYGDERFASRIADVIVAARPVSGTAELAELVRSAIPAATRRRGGHPAKRTFQALRIAVNQELDVLEPALEQAIDRLIPGGRGAVLTYHSGEDRIVKAVLRAAEAVSPSPRGLPVELAPEGSIALIRRGGVTPTVEEKARNPRAASARLRVFEKLEIAA
jgi:16S rRNA (cytosine1402-N4)-methyltransferase